MMKTSYSDKEKILVVLDRDGTLIYDNNGYFGRDDNWQEKLKLYPKTIEGIKQLNKLAKVIVASNQIGVARGYYSIERVKEINREIDSRLRAQGAVIDGWFFCPYVEKQWAQKNKLDVSNQWVVNQFPPTRKPETGMIKLAAEKKGRTVSSFERIFVVGNSLDDINMGLNAGGMGIFFKNQKNGRLNGEVDKLAEKYLGRIHKVRSLAEASKLIKKIIIKNDR